MCNIKMKDELLNLIPTPKARIVIILLLLSIPFLYAALGSLNEAWLQLSSQSLEKVRWLVIAIVIFLSSLYLNLHFIYAVKLLNKRIIFLVESREQLIIDTVNQTLENNKTHNKVLNSPSAGTAKSAAR